MVEIRFTAVIEPDEGGFHAFVPALPGCHTFGATVEEAQRHLIEAVELHVESMREDGLEVPFEREPVIVTSVTVPLASRASVFPSCKGRILSGLLSVLVSVSSANAAVTLYCVLTMAEEPPCRSMRDAMYRKALSRGSFATSQ